MCSVYKCRLSSFLEERWARGEKVEFKLYIRSALDPFVIIRIGRSGWSREHDSGGSEEIERAYVLGSSRRILSSDSRNSRTTNAPL